MSLIEKVLQGFLGNKNEKDVKELRKYAEKTLQAEKLLENLSHDELRAKSEGFKLKLKEATRTQREKIEELKAQEGDTLLTLKELAPVRLIKNEFFQQVQSAYENCATKEDLIKLLGRARAKKGMFEGDLVNGELEIGQVSALIDEVKSVKEVMDEILTELRQLDFSFAKVFE